MVGRLIDRVDRSGPLFGAEPTGDGNGNGTSGAPDPMSQYAELMSSFVSALFGGAPPPWRAGAGAGATSPSGSPRDGAVVADPLVIEPVPPGGRARRGAVAAQPQRRGGRRRAPALLATSGVTTVGRSRPRPIAFQPDAIDELPDLTSRGVRVAVDVPDDAPAGTYRGTVLASNLPDVWLVLELTVEAA